jgi:hypothetical protein
MRVLNLVLVGAVDQPAHHVGRHRFAAAHREVEVQQDGGQRQHLRQQNRLGGRLRSFEQDRTHPLTESLPARERFKRGENTKDEETRRLPISTRLAAVLEMVKTRPDGQPYSGAAYVFGVLGQRVQGIKKA